MRGAQRAAADRAFGAHVIRRQHAALRKSLRSLQREGFRAVHVLRSEAEAAEVTLTRTPLFSDRRQETGPFDVIGDVHGCLPELLALLEKLGYALARDESGRAVGAAHPGGRRAVFLGDVVDRGPDSPGVLRLVMGMVAAGTALAVPGNHEDKLLRALRGRKVRVSHGLETTLSQLEAEPAEFRAAVETFLDGLTSHYVLDGGKLVVAHAGLAEKLQGRASGRVRAFCLYGQTTGETDDTACLSAIRGRRVPGPGHGALRPHPGAGPGMGEQHAVPGHRLRLRRVPHRAELSRTSAGLRPFRPRLLRAGPAVPGGRRG